MHTVSEVAREILATGAKSVAVRCGSMSYGDACRGLSDALGDVIEWDVMRGKLHRKDGGVVHVLLSFVRPEGLDAEMEFAL